MLLDCIGDSTQPSLVQVISLSKAVNTFRTETYFCVEVGFECFVWNMCYTVPEYLIIVPPSSKRENDTRPVQRLRVLCLN